MGYEAIRYSLLACSSCSTNSVDVVLDILGHVIVYDDSDIFDIKSSGCYISGNQNIGAAAGS